MRDRHQQKRRGGLTRRNVDTREPLPRFLIVCEGEQTEPNYFNSFRVPREVITIRGVGDNTLWLVQRAIELRDAADYDQTWCVFDRDSFPSDHFNRGLALARREQIHVAYSNEAFELWYLLHFHFFNTALSRNDYGKKLSALLGHSYRKNSLSIYEELEPRQQLAISNARRLLEEYQPPNPERDNPSTTVHLLVVELMRYAR